ncbi:Fic family protein [Mycoplasma sp. NEAQ87857]|uniref:Fic family protein n=1 Tax=Mycoplasma sp. NEAQ87857 TaxID=2683967 RepID=UPI001316476E|nr:Fic family protein [Mycoplasma sp. NEAQ87857]QGZ97414.1 Fic family protein [Mycoplasma sp. NEAQ87857]
MKEFNYRKYNNWTWDNEIVNLVSLINYHQGKMEVFIKQKPAVLEHLAKVAMFESVQDSNKIEGIMASSSRIKELVENNTTPLNIEEQEILGYKDVLETINKNYQEIAINNNYILQLHRDLYQHSNKSFGGKFKDTPNVIVQVNSDGSMKERFRSLEPNQTPLAMENLCKEFNYALSKHDVNPLITISLFILDFLCIHPFSDGNGRMSRLLTSLLLQKEGHLISRYISLETRIERTKEAYYSALEQASSTWYNQDFNPIPFIKYMLRIILMSYVDFEQRVNYFDLNASSKEMIQRAIREKIGIFTKVEILDLVPSVKHATVENTLKELVEEGYIERHGKGKATFYVKSDKKDEL